MEKLKSREKSRQTAENKQTFDLRGKSRQTADKKQTFDLKRKIKIEGKISSKR